MKKYNYNFSIITTGGCSSSCNFCTDPFNVKPSDDYLLNLSKIILGKELSSTFDQVSVTGGEPTQSRHFSEILSLLNYDKNRPDGQFKKRVLTTNGWKLHKYIDNVWMVFDHVNISRHGIGDEENFKVFGGKNIATDAEIKEYASKLSQYGVDVNLNHVYKEHLTLDYIKTYISYAKSLNATKVTFRFDQNTNQMELSSTEQSVAQLYRNVEEGSCPVCREACYLIDGMYVTFKNSCAEPTQHLNGELYEIIYHVDGWLYKDWGKKLPYEKEQPIILKPKKVLNDPFDTIYSTTYASYGSGGCGSGGCGR